MIFDFFLRKYYNLKYRKQLLGNTMFDRKGIVLIKDILPIFAPNRECTVVKGKMLRKFFGVNVSVNTKTLRMFEREGIVCSHCRIKGKFFIIEKERLQTTAKYYSATLYAEKDGELIMMNKDHIIPKAMGGGASGKVNIQPTCIECNSKKGSVPVPCDFHKIFKEGRQVIESGKYVIEVNMKRKEKIA